jgi:hypothetical protein
LLKRNQFEHAFRLSLTGQFRLFVGFEKAAFCEGKRRRILVICEALVVGNDRGFDLLVEIGDASIRVLKGVLKGDVGELRRYARRLQERSM